MCVHLEGGTTLAGVGCRSLALAIEPDLRLLRGLVSVMQLLAERDDAVESVAIAALARLGDDAMIRIEAAWRDAHDGGATLPSAGDVAAERST